MINFNDLKEFNKQNKKLNGFRIASFRYHNKNNSGGNFAINYIKSDYGKEGYKNFELEGEYKTDFTFKYLRVGFAYQGLGTRLNLTEINTLSDLLKVFTQTIAEEEKTQEYLKKENEENQKEREQEEKNTIQATTTNENSEVKGLGCGEIESLSDLTGEQERNEILSELNNFTGTGQYHKISLGCLLVTDGFKGFCDRLKCFWLSDIVSSVQHLNKINENRTFILWKIKVNLDKSFIVRAYSDYSQAETEEENKKHLLYEQKGEYTDFKLNEYEFYQNENIVLLKSEY